MVTGHVGTYTLNVMATHPLDVLKINWIKKLSWPHVATENLKCGCSQMIHFVHKYYTEFQEWSVCVCKISLPLKTTVR